MFAGASEKFRKPKGFALPVMVGVGEDKTSDHLHEGVDGRTN